MNYERAYETVMISKDCSKEISKPCPRCKGKKKLPVFDAIDGKLNGSYKCPKCNGGTEPGHWTDNY